MGFRNYETMLTKGYMLIFISPRVSNPHLPRLSRSHHANNVIISFKKHSHSKSNFAGIFLYSKEIELDKYFEAYPAEHAILARFIVSYPKVCRKDRSILAFKYQSRVKQNQSQFRVRTRKTFYSSSFKLRHF